MNNDLINGCFELLGGLLVLLHIRRLWQDKQVKGLSIWPNLFFASWGWWNTYYYPSLGQWMSFIGGTFLALVSTIYCALLAYYLFLCVTDDYQ